MVEMQNAIFLDIRDECEQDMRVHFQQLSRQHALINPGAHHGKTSHIYFGTPQVYKLYSTTDPKECVLGLTTMTLTTSLRYLSLLLLSIASSGSGYDLVNPDLQPTYECNPNVDIYSARPQPLNCAVAVAQLPRSRRNVDWHRDPHGQVMYNRPLTSTGDPTSPNHLPHVARVAECRVRVELRPGVQSANLVWSDVSVFALMLVRRCVGDEQTTLYPSRGPGSGGICDLDDVRITVESVRVPRLPEVSESSTGSTLSDRLISSA